jgi:FtsP/CotA-like multicopper oxidase with cupredoxin domain
VTRAVIAPDGIEHEALLVNNQFPGPLIEANWGDEIHITVHNNIQGPEEGFALHTHGLLHRFHPWEDGVPSISQCPIAPGTSYTYKVVADQYGTSWWHSHYSSQYVGGVFGPLVIHGPSEAEYDVDVGPVMLHDYYHAGYHDIVAQLMAPNLTAGVPYSTNNMINGKMFANCANSTLPCTPNAPISQFQFQKGKKHLLRLINAGSEGQQIFSIDEHEMTVVSADYVPIQPYTTKSIILAVGQRADVVVEANGDRDAYFMRSNISHCNAALQPHAVAAIYYDDADDNQNPYSDAWDLPENPLCMEAPLDQTVPVKEVALPEPDLTIQIIYSMFLNSSAIISFTANNVTFMGDSNRPTLLQANEGNTTFPPARNVQDVGDAKSVRVVAYNNVAEP